MAIKVIVTCEHAGNFVPAEYAGLFSGHKKLLNTHQGYDIGGRELFNCIAGEVADYRFSCGVSRLLIDMNRSLLNHSLFSSLTKNLSEKQKERLRQKYYFPYRQRITALIERLIAEHNTVIMLAVHTFTPVLHGKRRGADIGLLYDPRRKEEKRLCRSIRQNLRVLLPELKIRFNYPYRGSSDGLAAYLRKRFPAAGYCGIELEVNQKFSISDKRQWQCMRKSIARSLRITLPKLDI
ncbi:MAG: N-formylglutamate amidohydrolase [Candidatus Omnitrophica bacterium]|nr:N-formylglutamate amidohydrolase [Candidatus Omnitrophota bacterium]MBU4479233.1 N-formylglutamate amidohydrolase [Candidatus Omnitrophota bacterium]MCG2703923.1 N-formylglutamate amidohydrolase [Candidatus Omnitrophota bacterium]